MKNTKRRNLWVTAAVAATVALLTIVNSVAGGLISGGIQQGSFAGLSTWLWIFGGTAGLVAIFTFWLGLRATDDADKTNVLAISNEYEALRRQYLTRLNDQFQFLPLRSIDYKTASAETGEDDRLRLADIYIQLNTTERQIDEEHERRSTKRSAGDQAGGMAFFEQSDEEPNLSALHALIENPCMVLLGDPGGGKSTFVNHLAFCLACHELEADRRWIERLEEWPEKWRHILPVPIVLREVAAWFQKTHHNKRGVGLFHAYLEHWLTDLGLENFQDLLEQHLKNGSALLLLDGLDEVPLVDDILSRLKEMIEDLPNAYRNTTILVTCRVLSYQDERWQLDDKEWRDFELAQLNEEQIDGFIKAWHGQLAVVNAVKNPDALNEKLSQAVRRPDLVRLARNPLLLTVMALVHTHKGELPDARSVLYDDVVDLLLWRWEAIKHEDAQGNETTWRQQLQEAELTDNDVKEALWLLAFDAHAKASSNDDGETTADISEQDLLNALRALHPTQSWDWAAALVELMKLRAGLLVESRPRVYTFPHRTFQEYLAGCHLSQMVDFAPECVRLGKEGPYWREAIRLAVGRLVHHNRDIGKALVLVSELCPKVRPASGDANSWRQTELAGECLLEIGIARATRRHALGQEMVERLQDRLPRAMIAEILEPRERAEIGKLLSRIDDPRDLDEMIHIPGGTFTMGTSDAEEEAAVQSQMNAGGVDEKQVRKWIQNEKPQHEVELSDFYIAKYPVTNGQYEKFVTATGHEPPQHWNGQTAPAELRNHPVTYVSWEDVNAYCAWLSKTHGKEFRLPSEAEWEKAARGTDKRLYPWEGDFDPTKCNARETGILTTTSVGLFPSGASPSGCVDMAGNVLEWTADWYAENYYASSLTQDPRVPESGESRVLRGGAFDGFRGLVRCAVRFAGVPDLMLSYVGFRVSSPG